MRFSARYICIITVAMYAGAAVSLADRVESTPQDGFDAMRGSFQPAKAKVCTPVTNGT